MPTYTLYILMLLQPAPAQPLYTNERFADPASCQLRIDELKEQQPLKSFTCRKIVSTIDLLHPPKKESK